MIKRNNIFCQAHKVINMSGRGFGGGRGGWRQGVDGPSQCVCPKCGYKVPM